MDQEKLARSVVQALVDDWALVEDTDDDKNLILVNEDRMEGLQRSRDFIAWMEEKGYIKNFGVPIDAEPIYGEYTRTYPDGQLKFIKCVTRMCLTLDRRRKA